MPLLSPKTENCLQATRKSYHRKGNKDSPYNDHRLTPFFPANQCCRRCLEESSSGCGWVCGGTCDTWQRLTPVQSLGKDLSHEEDKQ